MKRHLKKRTGTSRRQLGALGALGTAGYWAASRNPLAARLLRGIIQETSRRIAAPNHRPSPSDWNANHITVAWLGHSTVLINFYGVTILTDPVLFGRIGADLRIGTIGPRRLIAPALTVQQLPHIDIVLLSHAHMDHMDMPTLKCLPATTRALVAKSTSDLLKKTRIQKVTELGWGDKSRVHTRHGDVEVQAFEVNHWGARWRSDTHRGYNGYVLSRGGKRLLFGGDTALSPTFKSLHSKHPFEVAIMPIGAYKPWLCSHCTPEEAVHMAEAAGFEYFLPIHHKTFPLGREDRSEPLQRLQAAIDKERLALREVGETFVLD